MFSQGHPHYAPATDQVSGVTSSAGIDFESGTMVALFNPREQTWTEHFVFQGAFALGLTPVGWATVQVLDMNAKERMKIREDVRATGDLE